MFDTDEAVPVPSAPADPAAVPLERVEAHGVPSRSRYRYEPAGAADRRWGPGWTKVMSTG